MVLPSIMQPSCFAVNWSCLYKCACLNNIHYVYNKYSHETMLFTSKDASCSMKKAGSNQQEIRCICRDWFRFCSCGWYPFDTPNGARNWKRHVMKAIISPVNHRTRYSMIKFCPERTQCSAFTAVNRAVNGAATAGAISWLFASVLSVCGSLLDSPVLKVCQNAVDERLQQAVNRMPWMSHVRHWWDAVAVNGLRPRQIAHSRHWWDWALVSWSLNIWVQNFRAMCEMKWN